MTDPQNPRIAFIGSGVMAEVMIRGLLSRQVVAPESIRARGPGSRGRSRHRGMAVKSQTLAKLLKQLCGTVRPDQLARPAGPGHPGNTGEKELRPPLLP